MPTQIEPKIQRRRPRPWKVRMFEYGIRNEDLAQMFNRSKGYVSERVSGKKPWDTTELMQLAGVLGVRSVHDFIETLLPELGRLEH